MTIVDKLERVRYAAGQILSAQDLADAQAYFLNRLRRHNRFLHGWGVVSGLEVSLSAPAALSIGAGLALDCAGNELVVGTPLQLGITSTATTQFVVLRYAEEDAALVPVAGPDPICTRVREGAVCTLVDANPASHHRGRGPGTAGCGLAHALCLASIRFHLSGWKLRPAPRRRAAR